MAVIFRIWRGRLSSRSFSACRAIHRRLSALTVLLALAGPSAHAGSPCPPAGTSAESPATVQCLLDAGRPAEALLMTQRLLVGARDDPALRSMLAEALAAMDARDAGAAFPAAADAGRPWLQRLDEHFRRTTWVTLAGGYDSNLNGATASSTVQLPLLNYRSLTLDPLLVRKASPFAEATAGLGLYKPLSSGLAVSASGSFALRLNSAEYAYLPHRSEGIVAIDSRHGELRLAAEADFAQQWVAGHQLLGRRAITGRIGLARPAPWLVELGISLARNRYPQFQKVETRQRSGSFSIGHTGWGASATLHGGSESASGEIRDLDRGFRGLTLAIRQPLSGAGTLSVQFSLLRSDYRLPSPLFDRVRVDTSSEWVLAYEHRLNDDWVMRPILRAEENRSSIPLVAYRRQQAMIEFRRNF